jgi:hypothetical protein
MADQRPNGLVITDDAGNYYYLRPEILAQAKMPDAEVKRMKEGLIAASKGKDHELSVEDLGAVAGGANVPLAHLPSAFNIPTLSHTGLGKGGPTMEGTIMCPW